MGGIEGEGQRCIFFLHPVLHPLLSFSKIFIFVAVSYLILGRLGERRARSAGVTRDMMLHSPLMRHDVAVVSLLWVIITNTLLFTSLLHFTSHMSMDSLLCVVITIHQPWTHFSTQYSHPNDESTHFTAEPQVHSRRQHPHLTPGRNLVFSDN